jgi:uncharacterized membrane protein
MVWLFVVFVVPVVADSFAFSRVSVLKEVRRAWARDTPGGAQSTMNSFAPGVVEERCGSAASATW